MQHHTRYAGVARLCCVQRNRNAQAVFQRQHHANQHRLATKGCAQLLDIALRLPLQHLRHRHGGEGIAGTVVDQALPTCRCA